MAMLYQIRKISMEQWFVIFVFLATIILSFLSGYIVFRYWQMDECKSDMQIGDFGDY